MVETYPYRLVWSQESSTPSKVTVCLSLHHYQSHTIETLQSVYQQTQATLDLVVVEDNFTDDFSGIVRKWTIDHAHRFNRVKIVQHREKLGSSAARNTAVAISRTPYIFTLNEDSFLYPRCIERCLEALESNIQAAMTYPIIEKLGKRPTLVGNVVWSLEQFKRENPIGAVSLVRKTALINVGGYLELSAVGEFGWEDYELWCKFFEHELYGIPVPEILARTRSQISSTPKSISSQTAITNRLIHQMMGLHPWLELAG